MPNVGDEACTNNAVKAAGWDSSFEYPMPLIVRNTFFEVVARQPDLDEFLHERKVQSSPSTLQTRTAVEAQNYPPSPSSSSSAVPETDPHPTCAPSSSSANIAAPCARFVSTMPSYGGDYTGFEQNSSLHPNEYAEYMYNASNLAGYSLAPPSVPLARRATTSGTSLSALTSSFTPHQEVRAPLIPGLVSPTSHGIAANFEGRRTSGPSTSTGLLVAVRADEPTEYTDGSSDDGEEVPVIAGSDSAELGSALCPTLGSRGHSLRMCKPCAFILKGCQSGTECKFCHLCEVGEKKRRKKEKLVFRREMSKWRQSLTPTGGWKPGGFWR